MDILNSRYEKLKCKDCQLILQSPVILPCGHSICKNHIGVINDNENFYHCQPCDKDHKQTQFPSNAWAIDLINGLVGYKRAENACESLKSTITELESLKREFTRIRDDTRRNLRRQAFNYRNELLNEVKGKYEQFIFTLNVDEQKFIDLKKEVESKVTNWNSNLETNLSDLKRLNPNSEANWKSIIQSCKIEEKKMIDEKRCLNLQSQLAMEKNGNFLQLKLLNMGSKLVFCFKQ
jgi:hypothetical protein